ncbi:hypothetical protein ES896_12160 [Bacillus sp. 005/A4HT-01/001]|nr:hypothetical protein ES896_12160 [Bacillus sp. 005/A4HT-01/001]
MDKRQFQSACLKGWYRETSLLVPYGMRGFFYCFLIRICMWRNRYELQRHLINAKNRIPDEREPAEQRA